MNLIDAYQAQVNQGLIEDDPLQRDLLMSFQRVADDLNCYKRKWLSRRTKQQYQGLYIYGPVGAGKTFLMDLFYTHVATPNKLRLHLHQFMQQIDAGLRRKQGAKDPLKLIAAEFAKKVRLLCFDEFVVSDIATAMILANLLGYLLDNGVILVITSNAKPDDLYPNGLQRVRFLPAIERLKTHCQVVSIAEQRDYRLGRQPLKEAYFYPHTAETTQQLQKIFNQYVKGQVLTTDLQVNNRPIACVKRSDNIVWFEFSSICQMPRSQLDYLVIAKQFDIVIVTGLPKLHERDTVAALLLTHFVDVMYDQKVRVIFSAAVPIDELYTQGEMLFTFRRTKSRLHEMRSQDYS